MIAQITTAHGLPIPGAMVTFKAPVAGPGASFGGWGSVTVVSDSGGFAVAHGMKPNGIPGRWTLEIRAEGPGWRAMERVTQRNAPPESPASEAGAAHGWTPLDAAVGLGGVSAAVGVVLLLRKIRREPTLARQAAPKRRTEAPARTGVAGAPAAHTAAAG